MLTSRSAFRYVALPTAFFVVAIGGAVISAVDVHGFANVGTELLQAIIRRDGPLGARGRIVEIFGPESSGKMTLVYHVIAGAQRRGGIAAYIDAEHAMDDPTYAKRIGVNIDDLLVSVAALTPKAEIEGEMGDSHVGLQARVMSQALRKLAGTLNRTDTICLFTNQLREKIGVMFG